MSDAENQPLYKANTIDSNVNLLSPIDVVEQKNPIKKKKHSIHKVTKSIDHTRRVISQRDSGITASYEYKSS